MTDNCAAFTSALVRAADGSASAQEQSQLEAHLATCAGCAAALADQRAVHAWLSSDLAEVAGASLGFDTRVMAAVRAEAQSRARSWLDSLDFRRWTFRLVPVAAALALAAMVVSGTEASGEIDTPVTSTATADTTPVSSALWSDSVSGSSLLSLMLSASADDALDTYRKDQ